MSSKKIYSNLLNTSDYNQQYNKEIQKLNNIFYPENCKGEQQQLPL